MELVHKTAGTASVAKDYDSMKDLAGDQESSYFLFRIAGPTNWILISYVPEANVKVQEKMLYAATKNTLKNKLGQQWFAEEIHLTSPEELTYTYYVKSKEPINSLSEFEQLRIKLNAAEEAERTDRSKDFTTAPGAAEKIGGYHHVLIPLSENAKSEINRYKSGGVNFVELAINAKAETIEVSQAKSVMPSELARAINNVEPRFYIYNYNRAIGGKTTVFIYCCPENSATQFRMVYATSKPTVASQIEKLGVGLVTKVEVQDPASVTDEFLRSEVSSGASKASPTSRYTAAPSSGYNRTGGPGGGVVLKKTTEKQAPHPIYGLMSEGGGSPNPQKKKVVIPPPGAW